MLRGLGDLEAGGTGGMPGEWKVEGTGSACLPVSNLSLTLEVLLQNPTNHSFENHSREGSGKPLSAFMVFFF